MGAVERFERQLRERLAAAPDAERPLILRDAVDLAKPLVNSGQVSRAKAISTILAIGQQLGVKTLKRKATGLFAGPPFHDGPAAA